MIEPHIMADVDRLLNDASADTHVVDISDLADALISAHSLDQSRHDEVLDAFLRQATSAGLSVQMRGNRKDFTPPHDQVSETGADARHMAQTSSPTASDQ